MRDLIAGYRSFRAAHFDDRSPSQSERATTSEIPSTLRQLSEYGQNPRALVVACCDARADPAIVFDTAPGDVFVLRNVANMVPPYTGVDGAHHGSCAAVEYSVVHLRVPLVLVMGHTQCGGAAAGLRKYGNGPNADPETFAMNEETGEGFIGSWVALARESVCAVCEKYDPDIRARMLEYELVRQSVKNLMTFPFVRSRVEAGELEIAGAVFSVWDGTLKVLQPDGSFASPADEVTEEKPRESDVEATTPAAKRSRES